jgi:hypothetical protein
MNHALLRRIFFLDMVADERARDHERRSANNALIAGILAAAGLLEYHLLVEHTASRDLLVLIYVMGLTKAVFLLWYRARN